MTTNEAIAHALRDFAIEFIAHRKADVIKRDLRNTEALIESLYAKVNADPVRGIFLMNVFANTYGRYQDMRRVYTKAGGTEMLQALEMWAEKEGLGKFSKGKYAAQNAGKTPQQIKESIAWGIIRKLKTQSGTKKRSWWNKGKTRDIEVFYVHLLRLYKESIVSEMKQAAG